MFFRCGASNVGYEGLRDIGQVTFCPSVLPLATGQVFFLWDDGWSEGIVVCGCLACWLGNDWLLIFGEQGSIIMAWRWGFSLSFVS